MLGRDAQAAREYARVEIVWRVQRARAPLSLLLPEPGGERCFATQCGRRMHSRCWPLSQRGHCDAPPAWCSKCAHLGGLGRSAARLRQNLRNADLFNRHAHAASGEWAAHTDFWLRGEVPQGDGWKSSKISRLSAHEWSLPRRRSVRPTRTNCCRKLTPARLAGPYRWLFTLTRGPTGQRPATQHVACIPTGRNMGRWLLAAACR